MLRSLPAVSAFVLLFLTSVASSAVTVVNPPTAVNLRIEGLDKTIFEGIVVTRGHNVTTVSGGTHHCDGTNLGANPTPGATCTSALDTASKEAHFTFDGTFDTEFDDFFITRIGASAETSTQFWGLLLNFQFTPVGGCQQEVTTLQHILWAFDAFNKVFFLEASGPEVAVVGKPAVYIVTDGSTGVPIANAAIGGTVTNSEGKATITFKHPGLQTLKAERSDSIRSNAVTTLVI